MVQDSYESLHGILCKDLIFCLLLRSCCSLHFSISFELLFIIFFELTFDCICSKDPVASSVPPFVNKSMMLFVLLDFLSTPVTEMVHFEPPFFLFTFQSARTSSEQRAIDSLFRGNPLTYTVGPAFILVNKSVREFKT